MKIQKEKITTTGKESPVSNNPTWRIVARDAFRAGCLINAD